MNAFDFAILNKLNQFEGLHPSFDQAVHSLSGANTFLTVGPIVAMYWWSWFKNGENNNNKNKEAREVIISVMLTCIISLIVIRLIALVLPFRVRPLVDPTNGLHFPKDNFDWVNWSSFPSDHAILFAALTTCCFFISRLCGWIALLDTTFLVLLPRVYLGIHYPTDILAGAAIGVGIAFLANQKNIKGLLAQRTFQFMDRHPGLFYTFFFLFMYQVADWFRGVVYVISVIIRHRLLP
jgi:undecaprenyl-diphosphatase